MKGKGRRSPGWVRLLDDRKLHAITTRTHRQWMAGEVSQRQDWLLDVCLSELAWRWRTAGRRGVRRCTCDFCWPSQAQLEVDGWPEEPELPF